MPRFNYVAHDNDGRKYKGSIIADSAADARAKLVGKGFFADEIQGTKTGSGSRKKIEKEDLVLFTERLAIMVEAGLPVMRGLRTLGEQTENIDLKELTFQLCLDLEDGNSLSYAFSQHPQVFSNFYVNMVRAGEAGGLLDKVLEALAEYLGKELDLRKKIKGAFMYPIIVLSVAVLAVGFLVTWVVPIFHKVYKQMGVQLPLPTIILINISNLLINYWWALLGGLVGIFIMSRVFYSLPTGRRMVDNVKLYFPIFGGLNRKVIMTRFIRTFGALFANGVGIMENLRIVSNLTANVIVKKLISEMKKDIGQGEKISTALTKQKFFPPMVIQMILVGEETGALDKMLHKTANFLDRDIDYTVARLVVSLEPILTVILAIVVGFIALAIYLPMFDLIGNMQRG